MGPKTKNILEKYSTFLNVLFSIPDSELDALTSTDSHRCYGPRKKPKGFFIGLQNYIFALELTKC